MRIDLAGRVAKIRLRDSEPLLPLVEAVVNSFHAIEDAQLTQSEIRITAHRESGMDLGEEAARLAPIEAFTIEDDGVGFTDENQESFETSDSSYKRDRGGKGIGRLLWLRAFDRAEVESTFGSVQLQERKFMFALPHGIDAVPAQPARSDSRRTVVRLIGLKEPWRRTAPRSLGKIATAIIEHCFLYFLRPNRPRIVLTDAFETVDLNSEFDSHFAGNARSHDFALRGQKFSLKCYRMRPAFGTHQLVLSADFREVQRSPLVKLLPNLQSSLVDEDGQAFYYYGVVQSSYLDDNVNAERTAFSIPQRHEDGDLYNEPTLVEIRSECARLIGADLSPFTKRIEEEKARRLQAFVQSSQPKYRPFLVRYREEALAELPPDASERVMDDVLHRLKARKEKETRKEARDFLDAQQTQDDAEHSRKVAELVDKIGDFERSALAEYVVHRKLVLDLFARALEQNKSSNKYALESVVHNIVFPMQATSDEEKFDKQNLWIIDERLTFHSFLASDKPLKSVEAIESDSLSRPDILMFDRPFVFGDTDQPLTSILLIEFKRPMRSEYEEDPVTQVYRLVREIKAGRFKDAHGVLLRPASGEIPAYCYVVADLTEALEIRLQNMGAVRTPDNMGYYGFNPNLNAYYEVISYGKVLADAKKRNRVLFEKLGLP
jgi:hypothetical protein